ncbi:MAG: hypothetical protein V9E94_04420 [Microthrixaceae bacterium]
MEFGGDAVAAALGLTGATPAGVVGELIEVGDDAILGASNRSFGDIPSNSSIR